MMINDHWMLLKHAKFNIQKTINIQKMKIMESGPITSRQIDGEKMETVTGFIVLGSKITADGDCIMKLKDTYSLEGKLWPT